MPPVPATPATPAAPSAVSAPAGVDPLRGASDPAPESPTSLFGTLLRTLLALALVLALAYLTLNWGLRRLLGIRPISQTVVQVHGRVALDAKKTVYLIEAGDEYLLLGAGEREVSLLARLDPERTRAALARKAERPSPAVAAGKPFWERLRVKPPPKAPGGTDGGPPQST